jgi:hypothetical protein
MSYDSLTRATKGALAETIYTQVIPEEYILAVGTRNWQYNQKAKRRRK